MTVTTAKIKFTRSPLKWAGGKFRVLERIVNCLPTDKTCFVEPFVGSGAVFINTDYKKYILNDINADLINFYHTLQQYGDEFVRRVKYYFKEKFNDEKQYYRLRIRFNKSKDSFERAMLFYYLNRHGYNGLCRYNSTGGFNVPFGRYETTRFSAEKLMFLYEKSQRALFFCQSFETFLQQHTAKNCVVYCDPPYAPIKQRSNFTNYSGNDFPLEHHTLLAKLAGQLAKKDIPMIISNHNTEFTRDIYQNARLETFKVRRLISRDAQQRNHADELLAVYGK